MKLKKIEKIFLAILPVLFFVLHYFVYLSDDSPLAFDGFILMSPQEEPLTIDKLTLKQAIHPNYFHPFQKMEYHYSEKSGSGETILIEQHPMLSVFSTDMNTILGDHMDYYDPEKDHMFVKGNGVSEYPNVLFFLVQYLIIIGFLYLVIKKFRTPDAG